MDDDQSDDVQKFKVVIIGESGVGKTSILNSYITDQYDPDITSTFSAQNVNKLVKLRDKAINLNIWDTAGQEKYRSLSKIFFKGVDVAILVYDITNEKSFKELKEYWYKELIKEARNNIGKLNT